MKKPEKQKKDKSKKVHSLRHQITAYFIGLLFLSILTITVINGAFLEKYYVSKKIDVLLDLRTTLESTDIDELMNSAFFRERIRKVRCSSHLASSSCRKVSCYANGFLRPVTDVPQRRHFTF